ncbi:MAG: hypothetical protein HC896_15935 [Bacteroidales bacterium]|nr:hypothetical protein [Bacteroidales bacterium]
MALIFDSQRFARALTAPETGNGIVQSYMAVLSPDSLGKVCYHFMSAWQYQDSIYKTGDGFLQAVKKETDELAADIHVGFKN